MSIEPVHAVLDRDDVVTNVILMDAATARQFDALQVFPGCRLMDVTDLQVRPGMGWELHGSTWVPPEPPPVPGAEPTAAPPSA